MAKQTIGIGASANDGTGDPIRTAFDRCNDNFDELYLVADGLGSASGADISTNTSLGTSDTLVPSQKAVKTYIDTAFTGLLEFKGAIDCSANPNYPAASKGDTYIVSVAGKIGGALGASVDAGDVAMAAADNAGGTQASVGSSWAIVEHNGVYGGGGGGGGDMLASLNLSDVASKVAAKDNISVKGTTIASAGTTDLSAATGDFVDISGTTTITAFGTCAAGVERQLRFTGALTLTHNATSLILPTGANITTANGDTARFRSLGSGNWLCVGYSRANGQALAAASSTGQTDEATWTVPTASMFTLQNGGTTTMNDASRGLWLDAPQGTSGIRFLKHTAGPASFTSFTMIFRARQDLYETNAGYTGCVILRNSSSGKISLFGSYQRGTTCVAQRWTNYTTFSANIGSNPAFDFVRFPWRKLVVSGGTASLYVGRDGNAWSTSALVTETIATFLGSIDEVGVGIFVASGEDADCTFSSFTIT